MRATSTVFNLLMHFSQIAKPGSSLRTRGTRDGRALLDVGRRALAAGKPVFLWKGGVTEQGARAAASHTAR